MLRQLQPLLSSASTFNCRNQFVWRKMILFPMFFRRIHRTVDSQAAVHPKMRLFVTHCGLASTYEAMFYKVPILALPVYFDQFEIAMIMVKRNLSIQLNVFNLTSEQLRDSIKEILSNPMYKTNIEKMGELMTDTPLTARQKAVFWTEYALRHNGAPHLRSVAADMPWYQLFLLDVLAALILALIVCVWIVKVTVSFLIRLCSRPKTKTD